MHWLKLMQGRQGNCQHWNDMKRIFKTCPNWRQTNLKSQTLPSGYQYLPARAATICFWLFLAGKLVFGSIIIHMRHVGLFVKVLAPKISHVTADGHTKVTWLDGHLTWEITWSLRGESQHAQAHGLCWCATPAYLMAYWFQLLKKVFAIVGGQQEACEKGHL